MDRYQLATLTSWAGENGIQGRKRLQKVVYFLQSAGCPLDCRFSLHHYGPYSRDVADSCDEMVGLGLLLERVTPNMTGSQYSYTLAPHAVTLLADTEAKDAVRKQSLNPFRNLAEQLFRTDLWRLELGSTILFFQKRLNDWNAALSQACEFKKVPVNAPANLEAWNLAREVAKNATISAG